MTPESTPTIEELSSKPPDDWKEWCDAVMRDDKRLIQSDSKLPPDLVDNKVAENVMATLWTLLSVREQLQHVIGQGSLKTATCLANEISSIGGTLNIKNNLVNVSATINGNNLISFCFLDLASNPAAIVCSVNGSPYPEELFSRAKPTLKQMYDEIQSAHADHCTLELLSTSGKYPTKERLVHDLYLKNEQMKNQIDNQMKERKKEKKKEQIKEQIVAMIARRHGKDIKIDMNSNGTKVDMKISFNLS
jgi:hypothetical protein